MKRRGDVVIARFPSSGLSLASAVKCENLATVPESDILDILGHLSDPLKFKLDDSPKFYSARSAISFARPSLPRRG